LRQFGTGVSNLNAIADKCKADLGHNAGDDRDRLRRGGPAGGDQPDSYDIADIEYWICKKVFPQRRPAADGRQQAENTTTTSCRCSKPAS